MHLLVYTYQTPPRFVVVLHFVLFTLRVAAVFGDSPVICLALRSRQGE